MEVLDKESAALLSTSTSTALLRVALTPLAHTFTVARGSGAMMHSAASFGKSRQRHSSADPQRRPARLVLAACFLGSGARLVHAAGIA